MRKPVVTRTSAPGERPAYQVNDPEAFKRRLAAGSRIQRLRFAGLHAEADRLQAQLVKDEGG